MQFPFSVKPKKDFISVGNKDSGQFYFIRLNSRKNIERAELDQVDVIQSKAQLMLLKLAQKISNEKGISADDALMMILTQDLNSDTLLEYSKDLTEIMDLRETSDRLKDLVVTVMLRERLLYPVTLTEDVKEGSKILHVEELNYPIPVKSCIKFGSQKVYVNSESYPGDSEIYIENASTKIDKSVGFLLEENGQEKIGMPDIDKVSERITNFITELSSVKDYGTLTKLIVDLELSDIEKDIIYKAVERKGFESQDDLIKEIIFLARVSAIAELDTDVTDEIFAFYQRESNGGNKGFSKKSQSQNRSKSSRSSSTESRSTGETSTGEVESTEVLTSE